MQVITLDLNILLVNYVFRRNVAEMQIAVYNIEGLM